MIFPLLTTPEYLESQCVHMQVDTIHSAPTHVARQNATLILYSISVPHIKQMVLCIKHTMCSTALDDERFEVEGAGIGCDSSAKCDARWRVSILA